MSQQGSKVRGGAQEVLVRIRNLKKYFPIRRGLLQRQVGWIKAVDGISFEIYRGETLGLVGESGCGKTTTGEAILRLVEPTSGEVKIGDQVITNLERDDLRRARKDMQIIFQDPFSSLNPNLTVGQIIEEPLYLHRLGNSAERREKVRELLRRVGINPYYISRYPHEFSGGQRQRIGIARALATQPAFIVADEPLSALDVSIQAQVVNLLEELKEDFRLTYLFISHDLSMVRYISDRVAVMYLGQIVELARREDLYSCPLHPYTQALLSAIPAPDPRQSLKQQRMVLEGDVPSSANPPPACRFHPRCIHATDECRRVVPELRDLSQGTEPHLVACHHAEKFL